MKNNAPFLFVQEDTLLLDIGSGTQDILLAHTHVNFENWTRFILPSPAKMIAEKIQQSKAKKRSLILTGTIMGGGFFKAITAHLEAGLSIKSTQKAAYSLYDDIRKVESLGIEIIQENEVATYSDEDYDIIELADFSKSFWTEYLKNIGIALPKNIALAAQDHGIHEDVGNRIGRFRLWKELLQKSTDPLDWIFDTVPTPYTRLKALQESADASFVADTGSAALLGALSMPDIAARSEREGITIVNVGNSHVLAFLVYQSQVCGIYEHHTGMHDTDSLLRDLQEFRFGWLPDEEVREKGGHGCVFNSIPAEAEGFRPTYVLGPRREILDGHGQFINPHGDMMLAGAFGLLYAMHEKQQRKNQA